MEEGSEIRRDFIVKTDVSERMRERRKELCDRAISSEIRRRGTRHEGDKVDIIEVNNDQDIFVTKMRGDGEPSREVCGGPRTTMNSSGARGVNGKGRLDGLKTGASARDQRRGNNRTKTRRRDCLACRGNALSQGI